MTIIMGGITVRLIRNLRDVILLTSSVAALAACSATPHDGPRSGSFSGAAAERVTGSNPDGSAASLPFVLVDVDAKTVDVLERDYDTRYFKGEFTDRRSAADIRIGFGDMVRVTIFEAGSGGLFVPTNGTLSGGNFVTIPDQEVDRTGSISVPYAAKGSDGGVIKVYGRRPTEVQADIEKRLSNRALEPQVVVTVVGRESNLYSVLGDVSGPGRFNVSQNGLRILDAVSSAGGPTAAPYNTLVTLQRGSNTATARMSTLINEPKNNVYVRPNDVISVKSEERYYNIYGAVKTTERVPFDSPDLSLADAIAKAGGMDDERADPQTVVVYRRENVDTMKALGASLEGFKWQPEIPSVFRIDMTQPSSFFLAQGLKLKDGDMVYVSSHALNDITKLLSVVRDILLIRLIDN